MLAECLCKSQADFVQRRESVSDSASCGFGAREQRAGDRVIGDWRWQVNWTLGEGGSFRNDVRFVGGLSAPTRNPLGGCRGSCSIARLPADAPGPGASLQDSHN